MKEKLPLIPLHLEDTVLYQSKTMDEPVVATVIRIFKRRACIKLLPDGTEAVVHRKWLREEK